MALSLAVVFEHTAGAATRTWRAAAAAPPTALPSDEDVAAFALGELGGAGGDDAPSPRCFVLTQESGSRLYGAALVLGSVAAATTEPATSEPTARRVVIAVVALSRLSAFGALLSVLRQAWAAAGSDGPRLAAAVAALVSRVPAPAPGTAVCVHFGAAQEHGGALPAPVFSLPPLNGHPSSRCEDWALALLFRLLPPAAVVEAVRALLQERRVVVCIVDGPLLALVAPVCEALRSLLFPLHAWPHAYAPQLPPGVALGDLLDAPVPVLLGVRSDAVETLARTAPTSLEGVVVVNLDNATVGPVASATATAAAPWFSGASSSLSQASLAPLPQSIQRQLVLALTRAARGCFAPLACKSEFAAAFARPVGAASDGLQEVPAKSSCSLSLWEPPASPLRQGVQRAFLDMMLLLVGDYDEHMRDVESLGTAEAPEVLAEEPDAKRASAAAAYLGLRFDREAALACKRDYEPFVSALLATQGFDDFLTQRLRLSAWTDPEVLYFDAVVDGVLSGTPSPFLSAGAAAGSDDSSGESAPGRYGDAGFASRPMLTLSLPLASDGGGAEIAGPPAFGDAFATALRTLAAAEGAALVGSPLPRGALSPAAYASVAILGSPSLVAISEAAAAAVRGAEAGVAGHLVARERLRRRRISNVHEARASAPSAATAAGTVEAPGAAAVGGSWFTRLFIAPPSVLQAAPSSPADGAGEAAAADEGPVLLELQRQRLLERDRARRAASFALRSPLPAVSITPALASPVVHAQSTRKRRRMLALESAPPPPEAAAAVTVSAATSASATTSVGGEREPASVRFSSFVEEAAAANDPRDALIAELSARIGVLEEALEEANGTVRRLLLERESSEARACEIDRGRGHGAFCAQDGL